MRNINLFRLRIKTFLSSDVSLLHASLPIMQDAKLANNFSTLLRRNILAKGIAAIKNYFPIIISLILIVSKAPNFLGLNIS